MIFKQDIIEKINFDFAELSKNVFDIIQNAIIETDFLKTDRVIRCIIFLSKGKLENLNKFIEAAKMDTRDVMLWAEYENLDDENFKFKRVRDFNKTFDNCKLCVEN